MDGSTHDQPYAIPRARSSPADINEADRQEWARDFQPWKLLSVAASRVGKQAAILLFLFYEICSWNTKNHLILMNCRRDVLGWWVYSCEGTKAFARCFPLFAASMAMIVTGRYILQYRMYYHFLLKKVLLDYTNHDIKRDLVMILVIICFSFSCLHFMLDFFFPPYVTVDKMAMVLTTYFLPCAVFFLLWKEASDVEWRLMPLPKFVEEDPQWARQHIAESQKYLDTSIKHNFKKAYRKLYHEKEDHRFELDELLDEIIILSQPAESHFSAEPDHHDGEVKHGLHGLYKGLWPGRILLNPYLKDEPSKKFKKAFMVFAALFIVIQSALIIALTTSAVHEAMDAVPGGVPHDAFYAGECTSEGCSGEQAFERLGFSGYCRDEGQHRPPGYFISIEKLESQPLRKKTALLRRSVFRTLHIQHSGDADAERGFKTCANHCASTDHCIGFAMDPDLCNIYLNKELTAPDGWETLRAIHRASTKDQSSHTNWAIVTTDQSIGVTCFVKLQQGSEPENFVGCFVYACHVLMILWIIKRSAYMTFKTHFSIPS